MFYTDHSVIGGRVLIYKHCKSRKLVALHDPSKPCAGRPQSWHAETILAPWLLLGSEVLRVHTRDMRTAHACDRMQDFVKAQAWQKIANMEGAASHAAAADNTDLALTHLWERAPAICIPLQLRSQAKAICPGNAAICLQSATFKRTCSNTARPCLTAVYASRFHSGSSTALVFATLGPSSLAVSACCRCKDSGMDKRASKA